jgi:hypothetical protein
LARLQRGIDRRHVAGLARGLERLVGVVEPVAQFGRLALGRGFKRGPARGVDRRDLRQRGGIAGHRLRGQLPERGLVGARFAQLALLLAEAQAAGEVAHQVWLVDRGVHVIDAGHQT